MRDNATFSAGKLLAIVQGKLTNHTQAICPLQKASSIHHVFLKLSNLSSRPLVQTRQSVYEPSRRAHRTTATVKMSDRNKEYPDSCAEKFPTKMNSARKPKLNVPAKSVNYK